MINMWVIAQCDCSVFLILIVKSAATEKNLMSFPVKAIMGHPLVAEEIRSTTA